MGVFVRRDAEGAIVGLTQEAPAAEEAGLGQWAAAEADDPEVQAFVRQLAQAAENPLADTDAALARVTEDLIDILIDKGVIQFTDLPSAAQHKLLQRRQTRSRWTNRLNLLGDEDVI